MKTYDIYLGILSILGIISFVLIMYLLITMKKFKKYKKQYKAYVTYKKKGKVRVRGLKEEYFEENQKVSAKTSLQNQREVKELYKRSVEKANDLLPSAKGKNDAEIYAERKRALRKIKNEDTFTNDGNKEETRQEIYVPKPQVQVVESVEKVNVDMDKTEAISFTPNSVNVPKGDVETQQSIDLDKTEAITFTNNIVEDAMDSDKTEAIIFETKDIKVNEEDDDKTEAIIFNGMQYNDQKIEVVKNNMPQGVLLEDFDKTEITGVFMEESKDMQTITKVYQDEQGLHGLEDSTTLVGAFTEDTTNNKQKEEKDDFF